jgi:hypothetical protein
MGGEIVKQHITVGELLSLTPEQQERLREWWSPERGDWFYGHFSGWHELLCVYVEMKHTERGDEPYLWIDDHRGGFKSECLPLLSIGQCLELLCSKGVVTIEARPAVGFSMHIKVPVDAWGKESIDALFAAVKEVI